MAKITAKQETQEDSFENIVETSQEVVEVVKASRTQRVKSDVTLNEGVASFSYSVSGLTNEDGTVKPVVATLDLNTLLSVNAFVFKAAIEGIKSHLQTAYAGVTSPVEIEKIISDKFADFLTGSFESRMFTEKKVVISDVVVAWMAHVNADINDAAQVEKYVGAWAAKSKSEQAIFRNNKAIANQLLRIEQERVAKKAEKLSSSELPEVEIAAL